MYGKDSYKQDEPVEDDTFTVYRMKLPENDYIIEMKDSSGKIIKHAYSVFEDSYEEGEYHGWQGYYIEGTLDITRALLEETYGSFRDIEIVGANSNNEDVLSKDYDGGEVTYIMDSHLKGNVIEVKPFAGGATILTLTLKQGLDTWDVNYLVIISEHLDGYSFTFY